MDGPRSKKESKAERKHSFDGLVVTAISVAAAIPAGKAKRPSLEDAVNELGAKVEELSKQVRQMRNGIHYPRPDAAAGEAGSRKVNSAEQTAENNSQQKAQDVIYVRKASEFWFYN